MERNRLQRRLRELLRTGWLPAERERRSPRDLLLRARGAAYERSFPELRRELEGGLDMQFPPPASPC